MDKDKGPAAVRSALYGAAVILILGAALAATFVIIVKAVQWVF